MKQTLKDIEEEMVYLICREYKCFREEINPGSLKLVGNQDYRAKFNIPILHERGEVNWSSVKREAYL